MEKNHLLICNVKSAKAKLSSVAYQFEKQKIEERGKNI